MEETIRRVYKMKTIIQKENTNPVALYSECHDHLGKFNKQFKGYLTNQREKQLQCVLPSIENLGH